MPEMTKLRFLTCFKVHDFELAKDNDLNNAIKELSNHWYQKTGSMTAMEICKSSLHTGYAIGIKSATNLLVECKLQLQYLNEKFGETGTTNAIIAKIEYFIQK